MIRKLLHSRSGESLVEVLAASVVFLVLMGTLCAGMRFATGELVKTREVRDSVFQFQQSVRRNLAENNISDAGEGTLSFGDGSFTVPVRFQTVEAVSGDAVSHGETGGAITYGQKTVTFYLFAARDAAEGGIGP